MRTTRIWRRLCSLTALPLGVALPDAALAHPQPLEAGVRETLLHYLTQADHLLLISIVFALAVLARHWQKRHSERAHS